MIITLRHTLLLLVIAAFNVVGSVATFALPVGPTPTTAITTAPTFSQKLHRVSALYDLFKSYRKMTTLTREEIKAKYPALYEKLSAIENGPKPKPKKKGSAKAATTSSDSTATIAPVEDGPKPKAKTKTKPEKVAKAKAEPKDDSSKSDGRGKPSIIGIIAAACAIIGAILTLITALAIFASVGTLSIPLGVIGGILAFLGFGFGLLGGALSDDNEKESRGEIFAAIGFFLGGITLLVFASWVIYALGFHFA